MENNCKLDAKATPLAMARQKFAILHHFMIAEMASVVVREMHKIRKVLPILLKVELSIP